MQLYHPHLIILKKIITDNSPKKWVIKKIPQLELAVPTFEG